MGSKGKKSKINFNDNVRISGDFVNGNKNLINIDGINDSNIVLAGKGDINNSNKINTEALTIFSDLMKQVRQSDIENKDIVESSIKGLIEEQKKDVADKANVKKWLRFLAEMAPDIWEVVTSTILNPIYGFSVVIKKIAKKSKEENI